jgi:hypothetical protein
MLKKVLLGVLVAMLLGACEGGSGNYSTGGTYYTHEQLAQEFVRRANIDVSGMDVELVKTNTQQTDYIVVYDWNYGSYDAYYIGDYRPGEDLTSYLYTWYDYNYFYLTPDGYGNYEDPTTGTLFSKQTATGKNLAKLKSATEQLSILKSAEALQAKYGLSAEKSADAARFAFKLKNSAAGTYNMKDFDSFAKEFVGSTVTEFQADLKAGNNASLDDRVKKAAELTGAGTEGMNKIIGDLFSGK